MLTIKHVIWNGDFETIYQAKEVRAKYREHSKGAGSINEPSALDFIAFDTPNGAVNQITHGKVYVMNEAGKTVSTYDFGWNGPANVPPEFEKDTGQQVNVFATGTFTSAMRDAPGV